MKSIEEKSLLLAELMGWKITHDPDWVWPQMHEPYVHHSLRPYEECENGRAQFAAILLRFKEVITRFRLYTNEDRHIFDQWQRLNMQTEMWENIKSGPTQSDFLDEILAMHNLLD